MKEMNGQRTLCTTNNNTSSFARLQWDICCTALAAAVRRRVRVAGVRALVLLVVHILALRVLSIPLCCAVRSKCIEAAFH